MDNDQLIYDTAKNEFWYILQIGGLFMNYQPKWKLFSNIQFGIYLVIIGYHIILLIKTILLTFENNDVTTAALSVHFLMLGTLVTVVLISSYLNRQSLFTLFNNVAVKYYSYGDSTDTMLEDKFNKEARNIRILIFKAVPIYMLFCAAAWIIIVPLADKYEGPKETYITGIYMKTPIPLWFPYMIDNNFKYIISLASEASGAFLFATITAAADIGIMYFAIDLIIQLKMLNHSIAKIEERAQALYEQNGGKIKGNKLKSIEEREIYFNYVNYCIKQNVEHHKIINQTFIALAEVSKWPLMILYLSASIMIAMSMYAGVSGGSRLAPQLSSLLMLFAEIAFIFGICWLGQQISDQSDELFHQLYDVKWPHWNQRCKLSLIIVRERYKKTMVLDGGGMIASNFSTFTDIMSSAYSYFQLIYALEMEK